MSRRALGLCHRAAHLTHNLAIELATIRASSGGRDRRGREIREI